MSRYHVQRSIDIDAAPEKVFAVVADFATWTSWSPWLCAEPDAQVTVSPDSASVGSVYAWQGEVVGQGEIEHRHLQPATSIEDEIRFLKPFRSKSTVAFELAPAARGTRLTWHMHGRLPWFLFWMQSMMEAFIGMDYERGLRMLKERIETGRVRSQTHNRGIVSVGPLRMMGVRHTCAIRDVGRSMEQDLARARTALVDSHLPTDGKMISVYHKFDMKAQTFDYTSGFMVPDAVQTVPAGLTSWSIPAVRALSVEHVGSYEHLGNAWSAANQIARYKKLKQSTVGAFEIYQLAGRDVLPEDLRTEIYLPLR